VEAITFRIGEERVDVSGELLERYGTTGPRYTSYPPVPRWRDDFDVRDHATALSAAQAPARSVYVHVPFCARRCLYCGCNVVITQNRERADRYLDWIESEIDLVTGHVDGARPTVQVHWGGGTPTYLTPSQIERLWSAQVSRFPLAEGAEVGVEVDPRVTRREHLRTLAELGFNRLSLGVQDFAPEVQEAIGRVQSVELTREVIDQARDFGFGSVNVDLIYGLPRQTLEAFRRTLSSVRELGPERIALFNYAHLPHRFKHQRALPIADLPSGMDKLRLFTTAIEELTGTGYRFIGLDHFAREDDELATAHDDRTLYRNFMGYSTHAGTDLFAFGASAIASVGGRYVQNDPELATYGAALAEGRLPTRRGLELSGDDRMRRELITRLLCHDRVVRADMEDGYPDLLSEGFDVALAEDLTRLAPLIEDGLVTDDGCQIVVTPRGRLFVRNVAMCFDAPLHSGRGPSVQYSKTH
jgi:oxygen-independent coproporphyrinogen-3 oxidase